MQALALAAIAGGAGLSAYSTLQEGKEEAKLGKIAQQQYNAEAKATEQAGQYESREKRKEAARAKGARIAQILAQGGQVTGSSLKGVVDEAVEYEADARMISRNYGLQASQLRFAGSLEAYKGRVARRASRIRATSGIMQTAGMMYLMGGGGKGGTKTSTTAKTGSAGKATGGGINTTGGYVSGQYGTASRGLPSRR